MARLNLKMEPSGLRERTNIRRRYVDGPFGQIHIAESGCGRPVLLIHQTPRSWDEFFEVMKLTEDRIRVIAMDLPGMGNSEPTPAQASIHDYAKAAAAVAYSINDRDLVVGGHHTGGLVAFEMAAMAPELVASLVLSSTPWIDEAARELRAKKTPIDSVERSANGAHLLGLWKQRSPYYPEAPEYLDRFLKDALAAKTPVEGHTAVNQYVMELAVPKVKCPMLLIEHADDPFAQYSHNFLSKFPHARLSHIDKGRVALEVTAADFAEHLVAWVTANHADRIGNEFELI